MNRHDFSKKEQIKQYPSFWTSSRPEPPKPMTSIDVPKLDLKWDSSNQPSESTNLSNENTRLYED